MSCHPGAVPFQLLSTVFESDFVPFDDWFCCVCITAHLLVPGGSHVQAYGKLDGSGAVSSLSHWLSDWLADLGY